jgi:hypothetical protein
MVRPEQDLKLTDLFTLGALMKSVPIEQVRHSLARCGRESKRIRDLPADMMMYYVIALALFRAEETREVLRILLEGASTLRRDSEPVEPASRPGIVRARQRLGEAPLRDLYATIVQPIAVERTRGAWYRKWLTVALDGTTLETPDTVANAEAFGRPASTTGESACPRLRVVGLVETGTHVLFGASLGSYSTGEVTLAREVVSHLRPGMLCLADRYFPGYEIWKQVRETGAEMVWRIRTKVHLPREVELPDGSYLSHMYKRWNRGKPRGPGLPVRVIDYQVTGSSEQYRVVTTILDPEQAPAGELATLYHERWEFETALDEFKTHLRGARTVLRSQTPELIRQEVHGLLLAHFALRAVMHDAALQDDRDPDRISFLHTVRVVRRKLPRFAALPPSGLGASVRGADPGGAAGRPRTAQKPKGKARRAPETEPISSPAPN